MLKEAPISFRDVKIAVSGVFVVVVVVVVEDWCW